MIDNPLWLDLQRQVADLERRRDQLLVDRTPLHPSVQEIEGRLAEVKEQFAATPRQIPDNRVKNAAQPRRRRSSRLRSTTWPQENTTESSAN